MVQSFINDECLPFLEHNQMSSSMDDSLAFLEHPSGYVSRESQDEQIDIIMSSNPIDVPAFSYSTSGTQCSDVDEIARTTSPSSSFIQSRTTSSIPIFQYSEEEQTLSNASVNQRNIFYCCHELQLKPQGIHIIIMWIVCINNVHACMANFLLEGDKCMQIAKQVAGVLNKDQRAIIYIEKDASSLASSLNEAGYSSCCHRGQKLWRDGSIKVMVCTTALDMAINQPDIEVVIRIGCPSTLESMIQEFGRAGRDGRPAKG